MLDIVVYEDNKKFLQKNIDIINLALACSDIDYRICKCSNYLELDNMIIENNTRKIYILREWVNGISGLEIVNRIRKYDFKSMIIMAVNSNNYSLDNRLMVLDYVVIRDDYDNRMIDDIKHAISIIFKHNIFIFKYNHSIYRIPYEDICYIEKEPIVKRCIIHTINGEYNISSSINGILSKLNNDFCKTHQSCIVNLNNIERIDMSVNMIIFRDGSKTDMFTDKMKREVKKHMGIN